MRIYKNQIKNNKAVFDMVYLINCLIFAPQLVFCF